MALQTSGPISIGDINVELGRSRTTSNTSLNSAETGGITPLRTTASPKPNGNNPNTLSEWYGYQHNVAYIYLLYEGSSEGDNATCSSYSPYEIGLYSSSETLSIGTIMYSNEALTFPAYGPFTYYYASGDTLITINSSGVITSMFSCTSSSYSATTSGAIGIHYDYEFSNLVLDSNQDDDYTLITLPFNIIFDGNTYSECYVGSNSYITFGSGSTVYYGLDVPTAPGGLPAIKLSSDDNSYQRIYTEVFETGTFTIRYEGTNITSGIAGSPNMVWEVTFYENSNKLNIAWGINSRGNSSSTGYGMTNGTTAIFQDVDAFTGEYVSYIIQ